MGNKRRKKGKKRKGKKSKESKYPQVLQISASQLETAIAERSGCERKWYFQSHLYLPRVRKGSATFGVVIHAVAERWLKADRTGRDPETGKVVDLYPKGWKVEKQRNGQKAKVDPREAKLIKVLVAKAIEEGILEREEGRVVEHEFKEPVVKVKNPDGTVCKVHVKGYIDLLQPSGVEDHKSTANLRYAKSVNALRKTIQMLLYAKIYMIECERNGREIPELIYAAHNYFEKNFDTPRLRKVVTYIPREDVDQFWKKVVIPAAKNLVFLKRTKKWSDIPPPPSVAGACNAYGGCPYRSICNKSKSVGEYTSHTNKLIAAQTLNAEPEKKNKKKRKKGKKVEKQQKSYRELMKGNKNAAPPADKNKGVNPPVTKAAKKKAEKEKAALADKLGLTEDGPAPWADPKCVACEGKGMNTKGKPCTICVGLAPKELKPRNFTQSEDDKGNLTWTSKADGTTTTTPLPVGEVTSKTLEATPKEKPVSKKDKKAKKKAEREAAEKAAAETPETPATDPVKKKAVTKKAVTKKAPAKKTAPKKAQPMGFTICFGCLPSPADTLTIADLLLDLGSQLAKKSKKDSYFELDTFERRDKLAAVACKLGDKLEGKALLVPRVPSPDQLSLVEALRPYARLVVTGI